MFCIRISWIVEGEKMSNLKEFLDTHDFIPEYIDDAVIGIKELGVFFWSRGGKHFVLMAKEHLAGDEKYTDITIQQVLDFIEDASEDVISEFFRCEDGGKAYQDFLDALACLGDEEIKKLMLLEGIIL